MKTKHLEQFFSKAKKYVKGNKPDVLEWAKGIGPETFKRLKSREFLREYCWVTYASGFKVSILEDKFDDLERVYKNFDLGTLSRMRSIAPVMKIINHARKANGFLEGAKMIHEEGFSSFKKRIVKEGMSALEDLPFIGPVTKKHLAKNIGLADVAKNDRLLTRIKDEFKADSVDEVTKYLSKKYGMSEHVVDVILWQFCADKRPLA